MEGQEGSDAAAAENVAKGREEFAGLICVKNVLLIVFSTMWLICEHALIKAVDCN